MAIEVVLPADLNLIGAPRNSSSMSHSWKPLPKQPIVGLIDNTKTGAAEFLDALGRSLVRRGVAGSHFVWQKSSSNHKITPRERAEKLARAHVIVSGVGD